MRWMAMMIVREGTNSLPNLECHELHLFFLTEKCKENELIATFRPYTKPPFVYKINSLVHFHTVSPITYANRRCMNEDDMKKESNVTHHVPSFTNVVMPPVYPVTSYKLASLSWSGGWCYWTVLTAVPICLLSQWPYIINISVTKCVQSVCEAN